MLHIRALEHQRLDNRTKIPNSFPNPLSEGTLYQVRLTRLLISITCYSRATVGLLSSLHDALTVTIKSTKITMISLDPVNAMLQVFRYFQFA